jgi:hypothetical protein
MQSIAGQTYKEKYFLPTGRYLSWVWSIREALSRLSDKSYDRKQDKSFVTLPRGKAQWRFAKEVCNEFKLQDFSRC